MKQIYSHCSLPIFCSSTKVSEDIKIEEDKTIFINNLLLPKGPSCRKETLDSWWFWYCDKIGYFLIMNMIWIVHWSRSLSCSWWSLEWRSHSRICCESSEDHLQLCPSSWDESASWSGSTWSQRRRQRGERRGRLSNSAWQTPVWQLGPGAVAPSQQSLLSSSVWFH